MMKIPRKLKNLEKLWRELAELKQSKKLILLIAHSQLMLSSPRWKVSPKEAFDLVKSYIWEPMLIRMHTKHEILWKSRLRIIISPAFKCSKVVYNKQGYLLWKLPLLGKSGDLNEPLVFMNLKSFIFRHQVDKDNCLKIANILLTNE